MYYDHQRDLRDQFWELRKPEYFNMPKESMEQPRTQHWFHTYEIDYDETRVRKPKPRIPKLVGFPDTLRARYDPNMMLLLPSMTTNEELYPKTMVMKENYGDAAATEPILSSIETKEAPTEEKQLATDDLLLDQLELKLDEELEKVMAEEDMEARKEDDPPMKHSLD